MNQNAMLLGIAAELREFSTKVPCVAVDRELLDVARGMAADLADTYSPPRQFVELFAEICCAICCRPRGSACRIAAREQRCAMELLLEDLRTLSPGTPLA